MPSYLSATYFIDKEHPDIVDFSMGHTDPEASELDRAISLYYAVRDQIRYDPYSIQLEKETMKASAILAKKRGFCVAKAVVLAACLRQQNIPARLGFADVKNHLTTGKLKSLMGTDIFVWHGYTDIHLEGKWVKATPAFNRSLCDAFHVKPLAFDGRHDSVFHPYDTLGNRHMEYVTDHGFFEDLPWDRIVAGCKEAYPRYFRFMDRKTGNFRAEALAENSDSDVV